MLSGCRIARMSVPNGPFSRGVPGRHVLTTFGTLPAWSVRPTHSARSDGWKSAHIRRYVRGENTGSGTSRNRIRHVASGLLDYPASVA
jgi:hypothetical protein